MIYLDSSVALAHVLNEARRPTADFWRPGAISSRLLHFEVWNRLHAYAASARRQATARELLVSVGVLEMTHDALSRALLPFPVPVRTLDGLHLATMDHLRQRGIPITLASYDERLLGAAEAMGFGTVRP